MKAINIKWDVTDGSEDMSQKEMNEILETLPTEVDIPKNMENEDEISDWLSYEFGFCHYGFELIK